MPTSKTRSDFEPFRVIKIVLFDWNWCVLIGYSKTIIWYKTDDYQQPAAGMVCIVKFSRWFSNPNDPIQCGWNQTHAMFSENKIQNNTTKKRFVFHFIIHLFINCNAVEWRMSQYQLISDIQEYLDDMVCHVEHLLFVRLLCSLFIYTICINIVSCVRTRIVRWLFWKNVENKHNLTNPSRPAPNSSSILVLKMVTLFTNF